MPKALPPFECLKKMLDSKVKINKDKWESGLNNQYFEWEELRSDVLYAYEGYKKTSEGYYTLLKENEYLRERNKALLKDYNNALKKLYELENLEEEIGCPLEVVFKALKQNYAYFKFIGKVEFIVIDSTGNELLIHSNKENVGEYLHNYKKTWWLKEDRSE